MKPLTYVASPYSHPDPTVRLKRWKAVCRFAGRMLEDGHHVFSPIAHSHSIAEECQLSGDFAFWSEWCISMLRRCDDMIVLTLEGWSESVGVNHEIAVANSIGMRPRYVAFDGGVE